MLTHIKDARNYWTVVVNSKSYQFCPSNKNYDKLVDCIKNDDAQTFTTLIETGRAINNWSSGFFSVKDGVLKYKDEVVESVITNRILDMIEEGFDCNPILNFLEKLYNNVSMRSVVELYNFLEHKYLPITPDGCFIAYKGVVSYEAEDAIDKMGRSLKRGDLVDKYTEKSFRNNVGDVNTMHRRNVNDDARQGCSSGLHVGSLDYATNYAGNGVVVLCKVDPSDVVSVPFDSDCQKVRVTKYEVIGIYNGSKKLDKSVQMEEDAYEDEDYYSEHFEEDDE